MPDTRNVAIAFLSRHQMTVDAIDVDATLNDFLREMDNGLASDSGCLAMIPTFISAAAASIEEPVIVIDAGGTNLRVCTVTFHSDKAPSIENFAKFPMPGLDGEVSKANFFKTLAEHIAPMAHVSDKIGFCFSYPTEILPSRDGRLTCWTKEVQIPELVGELVGKGLTDTLASMGHGGKRVVILNDTVASLLAGKTVGESRQCSDYVGFILGTGTNTAYVERNSSITKRCDLDKDGAMIVNIESGNFAIARRSPIDVAFDARTANPNNQTFEKMISGAYLGPLCLEMLMMAAQEGMLSQGAIAVIEALSDLTTIDMDNFLGNPVEVGNPLADDRMTDEDREFLVTTCTEVVRRAALLAAINVAGTVIKSGHGRSPLHPVCVNVDGSTFHKTNNFPRWTLDVLDQILGNRGIHVITVHIENAPILGAAVAALSNTP